MSLTKGQVEWLRLEAQKCDHRNVGPTAHFDIAASLRSSQGRGGKMFEKRKDHADQHVVDESKGPMMYKVRGPLPWMGSQTEPAGRAFGVALKVVAKTKQAADHPKDDQEGKEENLTDAQRLQKLHRILGYVPSELQLPMKPARAPKFDLRTSVRMPPVPGRNFNRNAKGWTSSGERSAGNRDPDSVQSHPSNQTAFDEVDFPRSHPSSHSYRPTRPQSWPSSLFEAAAKQLGPLYLQGDYNPRPQGWQAVQFASPGSEQEYGDFNPRPKAWVSEHEPWNEDSFLDEFQHGDYNARPTPWESSGDTDPRCQVQYGDYNARPKAWWSAQTTHYLYKPRRKDLQYRNYNPRLRAWESDGSSPPLDGVQFGDYNPRPKAWRSGHSTHYVYKQDPTMECKFGDFNARPKAWEPKRPERSQSLHRLPGGDYNPKPKAWQSAPSDDSDTDSESSWTSTDSEHSYYIYLGRGRYPVAHASDV